METGYYSSTGRRSLLGSVGGWENGDGTYTDAPFEYHTAGGTLTYKSPSAPPFGDPAGWQTNGNYIVWPTTSQLLNEKWCWGKPSAGDFVPAGMAGVNYVSPGYN